MRALIDRCDRAETSRWRALGAGAAALVLALLLALAGIGLLSPSGAQAAGPFTFNDCASVTASDIATAFSAGESITYTGTTPCTVNLSQTTLTAPSGVVVNMTIEGGVGLTLDESNVLQNEIDFSLVGANSSLTLDHVTLANNRIGIFAPGAASPSITVTNSTISSNGGGIDAAAAGSASITVTNSTVGGINVERTVPGPTASPTVTVTDSMISGSDDGINAENTNSPHITVTNSTISGNTFNGIVAYGTAAPHISVTDSTISGNGADGINASSATGVNIAVTGSTLSSNGGTVNGNDGIDVKNAPGPGVSVINSTLSGNKGAGIDAFQANGSSISLANSTISGNVVAIDARYNSGSSTSVIFSTIDSNTSGGILAFGQTSGPTVNVTASILAGNGQNNCSVSIPAGPVTDGGYNLSTDTTCGFTSSTSLPNGSNTTAPTDTQLALLPLGSYAGLTQTIALGPNSVAIDLIPASVCATYTDPGTTTPISTDQRGIDRPQGSGCDAGAYEAPAVTIATTPGSPASSGWYNASQLGAGGTLPVKASFIGLADGELPTCTGAAFSGLPATPVSGLNQTASGSASLGGGTYSISCGVKQGTTALGVSQVPAQPVSLNVDTTPPTTNIVRPVNNTSYESGESILASYTCTDATSQIATTDGCVGTKSSGSPIDTSAFGPQTFTVNAVDQAGNTAKKSVTYTVSLPAPALTINGQSAQSSPYWYDLTNSPNVVTLAVSDSATAVTGYRCSDTIGTTTTDLPLTLAGTPPVGTATLGDGVQTLSCTATDGTNTSAATTVMIQVDRTPPSGECSVPDQSPWYDHNLSVSCTPTDATSGLSDTTPSSFSLTTSVKPGSASATAATGSQPICDVAGNCQTIGPFDFKVDLAPPVISSPSANASYIVSQVVTLGCADVGSGLNTCQVTVTLPDGSTTTVSQGSDIPTSQVGSYTVKPNTVTDLAGNADTTSFSYTVGYQIVALPGNTQTVDRDYYAVIRFYPADANGHDYANRNLKVTSIELDGSSGQVIPFAYTFQYATFSGKAGYQLSINTRNLPLGTWTLKIQIGTGTQASTGTVTFTVQ